LILETGALASHFTLLGIDGREYSLPKSLEGKAAVLVFFKTSCATCDLTFPYLNQLRRTYREGWHLWAVSQDTAERTGSYALEHGMDYPVLIDAPGYEVSRLYDPPATPTIFVIDPAGRVEFSTYGFSKADMNEIAGRIAGHVGEAAVIIAREDDGRPDFKPG